MLTVVTIRGLSLCAAMMACVSCRQQSPSLRIVSAGSAPGILELNLDLRNSRAGQLSAIQWSFSYSPALVTQVSVEKGPQLRPAAKHLSCFSTPGRTTCLVWGADSAALSDGAVAHARFALHGNPIRMNPAITLTDVAASSRDGAALRLAFAADHPSPAPLGSAVGIPSLLRGWAHARYRAVRSAAKAFYKTRLEPAL